MPPYALHLATSAQRTGNEDRRPLHDWLDNHADRKAARHDLIVIYADRLVDIYSAGIVPDTDEKKAEEHVAEILNAYAKCGKNPTTLQRYLALQAEIQGWMG